MGIFVNPGNKAFERKAINSEIYVDKTGLLEVTNNVIDTSLNLICNSRPRRFGKTTTANMLSAYYCKTCDSNTIFQGFEISKNKDYKKHLNKYDVIYWDIQWCIDLVGDPDSVLQYITYSTINELREFYPQVTAKTVTGALAEIYNSTGNGFVVIIDEWDSIIRDYADRSDLVKDYMNFLRGMFKGLGPDTYIHLAYMTGILPIKRYNTESALNNFKERTMLDSDSLAPYIGFTDSEVEQLCKKYDKDFQQVKLWYDGYRLNDYSIYNPVAVTNVLLGGGFKSYWSSTGSYEAVVSLINMNFDGLKDALVHMLAGDGVYVNISKFENDATTISSKDTAITYLIHLGYLAYNSTTQSAYVPNEEVRLTLLSSVEESKVTGLVNLMKDSSDLLRYTLAMDSASVAKYIEDFHMKYTAVIRYNNESSLSSVLIIAYIEALKYYMPPLQEMQTGDGYADIVFIPRYDMISKYPALVIELKYDKSAGTAINQIIGRKYVANVLRYTDNILLVGINYNKDTKKHECVIEKYSEKPKKAVDSQKVAGGEWQKKAEEMKAREEKSVLKLANKHLSVEDIADCLSMSVDSVKEILSRRNGGTLL